MAGSHVYECIYIVLTFQLSHRCMVGILSLLLLMLKTSSPLCHAAQVPVCADCARSVR